MSVTLHKAAPRTEITTPASELPIRKFHEIAAESDEFYAEYHQLGLQQLRKGPVRRKDLDTSCLEPIETKFPTTMPDYYCGIERYIIESRSMEPWSSEVAMVTSSAAAVATHAE